MSLAVVVPVLDAAPYLARTLELLDATRAHWAGVTEAAFEAVLVDDGSTDGSLELLTAFAADRDWVRLIADGQRRGAGGARNAGLEATSSDWVWFCDADDLWTPDLPAAMASAAIGADAQLAVAPAVERTGDHDRPAETLRPGVYGPGQLIDRVLSGDLHGFLWNKLFARSVVDGLRFPGLATQEDFCFSLEAIARADRVVATAEGEYVYLVHPTSLSRRAVPMEPSLWAALQVAERVAAAHPTPGRAARLARFRLWFYTANAANQATGLPALEGRSALRTVAARTRLGDVARTARRDPRTAVRALVVRLAPVVYGRVYAAAQAGRRAG